MATLYVRNDTSNNIANDKPANASDLDGEFDAIETGFADLHTAMQVSGANVAAQGTFSVAGAFTASAAATVGTTLGVAGASTLDSVSATAITIDNTTAATWARLIFNTDTASNQSINFTDDTAAVRATLKYIKNTDTLTFGNSSFTLQETAGPWTHNAVHTFDANIALQGGNATITRDGTVTQLSGGGDAVSLKGGTSYCKVAHTGSTDMYRSTTGTGTNVATVKSDIGGSETSVFLFRANGDVLNTTGSYGTISDARVKENIVDAGSQWDDILDVKFRNYNLIGRPETHLGVVAQELQEAGMTGLVSEDEDGTLSVKQSILFMKCAVALQEAMKKIEDLEERVGSLEGV